MFMSILTKNKTIILFLLIIFLAAFLRLYKLDRIPPSLNWDEAAGAYNAYTIANWGRDEWGKSFPLIFTSFKDDKHPVHIYLTALIVRIFGLSDFTTRLPGATIGILSVIVIFYLARTLFKSNLIGLLAALFLAVSPYHIHFSRGLWEVNFAFFFFILGLLMFYLALQKRNYFIIISFLCFGISILSYHSSKIVVPVVVLALSLVYFKDLKKLSLNFYTGIFIFFIFIALLFIDTRLLGLARVKQTQFSQDTIEKTQIFKKTKNSILGLGEIALKQYMMHFTPQYLFISGDQSPRNSTKTNGEFYKIDALFILIGLLYLLKLRSRVTLIILIWGLLAPIPASVVGGAPSAIRAVFMMGSLHLVSALGAGSLLNLFKSKIKYVILIVIVILLSIQAYSYLDYYFNAYTKKDAIEWQYGMKKIVEFVKSHPEYNQVFVTDIRSQPYIFFLLYLKMPLPEYLNTVMYNRAEESKRYNLVSSFDGFYIAQNGQPKTISLYFGGWDPIESLPNPGVLYVLSPSQYDGLRHRSDFGIKKVIRFPDGGDAFFLVSAKFFTDS
ncbi:MAG: glycosyltransferase family 39 protein, partial [Actinobacteria bacterium]|nr:glycosyltransferase family 39 protein [Actinomycetota bacterium]